MSWQLLKAHTPLQEIEIKHLGDDWRKRKNILLNGFARYFNLMKWDRCVDMEIWLI